MSGAQKDQPAAAAGAADPSMEDILASIRRILSEDETGAPATPVESEPSQTPPVLALEPSMMVEPEKSVEPEPEPVAVTPEPEPVPVAAAPPEPEPPAPAPVPVAPPESSLVAPETAAAAAGSVSSLLRTLASRQALAVSRNGPTLEDIVREEMRPLLKEWLDTNLPPLVERLVRAEIDRVVTDAIT